MLACNRNGSSHQTGHPAISEISMDETFQVWYSKGLHRFNDAIARKLDEQMLII